MTFFKVWGWVYLAACIVSAVSICVRAFISDEGTERAAAALVFPLACWLRMNDGESLQRTEAGDDVEVPQDFSRLHQAVMDASTTLALIYHDAAQSIVEAFKSCTNDGHRRG